MYYKIFLFLLCLLNGHYTCTATDQVALQNRLKNRFNSQVDPETNTFKKHISKAQGKIDTLKTYNFDATGQKLLEALGNLPAKNFTDADVAHALLLGKAELYTPGLRYPEAKDINVLTQKASLQGWWGFRTLTAAPKQNDLHQLLTKIIEERVAADNPDAASTVSMTAETEDEEESEEENDDDGDENKENSTTTLSPVSPQQEASAAASADAEQGAEETDSHPEANATLNNTSVEVQDDHDKTNTDEASTVSMTHTETEKNEDEEESEEESDDENEENSPTNLSPIRPSQEALSAASTDGEQVIQEEEEEEGSSKKEETGNKIKELHEILEINLDQSAFTPAGLKALDNITPSITAQKIALHFPLEDLPTLIQGSGYFRNSEKYTQIKDALKKMYYEAANKVLNLPLTITLTPLGEKIYEECGLKILQGTQLTAKNIAYSLYKGEYTLEELPQEPLDPALCAETIQQDLQFSGPFQLPFIAPKKDPRVSGPIQLIRLIENLKAHTEAIASLYDNPISTNPRPLSVADAQDDEAADPQITENLALLNKYMPMASLHVTRENFSAEGLKILAQKVIAADTKQTLDELYTFKSLAAVLAFDENWQFTEIYYSEPGVAEERMIPFSQEAYLALKSLTKESITQFEEAIANLPKDSALTDAPVSDQPLLTDQDKKILATFNSLAEKNIPFNDADKAYSLFSGSVQKAPSDLFTTPEIEKILHAPLSYGQLEFAKLIKNRGFTPLDSQRSRTIREQQRLAERTVAGTLPSSLPTETTDALGLISHYHDVSVEDAARALGRTTIAETIETNPKIKEVFPMLKTPEVTNPTSEKNDAVASVTLPEPPAHPEPTAPTQPKEEQSLLNAQTISGGVLTTGGLSGLIYLLTNPQTRSYSLDYLRNLYSKKHRANFATRTPLYKELAKNYGRKAAAAILASISGGTLLWLGLQKKS